jgi:hypothetical protein
VVGEGVGTWVGCGVGTMLGSTVGEWVGASDGVADGAGVGTGVGTGVGAGVGSWLRPRSAKSGHGVWKGPLKWARLVLVASACVLVLMSSWVPSKRTESVGSTSTAVVDDTVTVSTSSR